MSLPRTFEEMDTNHPHYFSVKLSYQYMVITAHISEKIFGKGNSFSYQSKRVRPDIPAFSSH